MKKQIIKGEVSLRLFSTVIILILTGVILIFVVLNVMGAYQLDSRVRSSMQQVLAYYGAQTDARLTQVENYVFGELVTDDDFGYLIRGGDSRRPEHLMKIREKLSTLYTYYSDMDGFFIYEEETDLLMMHIYTGNNNRLLLKNAARSQILRSCLKNACDRESAGRWQLKDIDGISCAVYAAYYRGFYMGTVLSLDSVLGHFGTDSVLNGGEFYLADSEGNELTGTRTRCVSRRTSVVTENGEKMMQISQDMGHLPVRIVALVPLNGISGLWQSFLPLFICLLVLTALVLAGVILGYYHMLMKPLRALDDSIRRFSEGDLGARATEFSHCAEIDQVNRNFNQMTEQIETLKIESYEKELENRDIDLRYRQIQMNPHFFLNILNVIYTLAISGSTGKIKEVTLDLMKYMRYILSVKDKLVPLKDEMEFVDNYIRIQRLRVSYGTNVEISGLDESTAPVRVPPLTVQTFVENAFKYAVRDGESLSIGISFVISGDELQISVRDDGTGFPGDMVTTINKEGQVLPDARGEHVGISNVLARLRILYGPRFRYQVGNRPEGGGEVILYVPLSGDEV